MSKRLSLFDRITQEAELSQPPVPGQCIVEISGDRRVLVENHQGVLGYGREKIIVKVRFGTVTVCGAGLEMMRMTRDQLVIRGRIDGISLGRRETK